MELNNEETVKFTLPDEDLVTQITNWYKEARDASAPWRKEAEECQNFVAGHQWSDEDIQKLTTEKRPNITFNWVGPMVAAILGMESNQRNEIRFQPRETSDTGLADGLNAICNALRDMASIDEEEADAFEDVVITGMGWCLSNDALVKLPKIHFATTRLYSGQIVQINLENGKQLTGTPNHPVLTDIGWKRLCDLHEGDNLVNSRFLERVKGFPVNQFDKMETRLEDKVNAFRTGCKGLRLPTAPDDFYSDGIGSKVHVVYADSLLLNKIKYFSLMKTFTQKLFSWWDYFTQMGTAFFRNGLYQSSVFSPESQPSLSFAHTPSSHSPGNNIISKSVSRRAKSAPDAFRLFQMESVSNLVGRQPLIKIQPRGFFDCYHRFGATFKRSEFETSPCQSRSHSTTRYSNFISNFFDWKPILEIQARNFFSRNRAMSQFKTRVCSRIVNYVTDFPVHDIGTSYGMFIAGNIITSNTETRMDYDEDLDGRFQQEAVDCNEMFWDPTARKPNLTDRRWQIHAKRMTKQAILEQWPDKEIEFTVEEDDAKIDTVTVVNPADRYTEDTPFNNVKDKRYTVYRCQWWEKQPIYRIEEPLTKSIVQVNEKEYKENAKAIKLFGIPSVKQHKRVYYQAFICGKVLLEKKLAPSQVRFTYSCMTGKRDRAKNCWYGIVRPMLDPQRWSNKFFSQILDIINSNAKGGIMAEQDAFMDARKAETDWAKSDSIIWLKPGAVGAGKIQNKPQAPYPQGLDKLMQFAISSIRGVSGINLEMLGMADRQQAGVLEDMRKQSAFTILAKVFESLKMYRKDAGVLLIDFVNKYVPMNKIQAILAPDAKKYADIIKSTTPDMTDIVVSEAATSENNKAFVWGFFTQIMPMIMKAGIPFPPEMLDYSPLPATIVEKWKVMLQPPPQGGPPQGGQPPPEQPPGMPPGIPRQLMAMLGQRQQ